MTPLAIRENKTFYPTIDTTTIQKFANRGSKLSVIGGSAVAIKAAINFDLASIITAIAYAALLWFVCRGISYACTKPKDNLLNSKLDSQYGLKISENYVKVTAYPLKAREVMNALSLKQKQVIMTPFYSFERIEFVAPEQTIRKFFEFVQECKNKQDIKYTISPIYDSWGKKNTTKSSRTEELAWKISSSIMLVVFSPKKWCEEVKQAIYRNQGKTRKNSQSLTTEDGTARWETMGKIKKPGPYRTCEKADETKITTEVHRSNLINTLYGIVGANLYNEVGYDLYLLYALRDSSKVVTNKSKLSELLRKISKFVKFLHVLNDVPLRLSSDVKLIICTTSKDSDNVRALFGEKGGGLIGNYAHCSFTIGEPSSQSQKDLRVRIETVVAKKIIREVTQALNKFKPRVTYSLQPMFQRIDTKTLRQKQHFWNAIIDFLTT